MKFLVFLPPCCRGGNKALAEESVTTRSMPFYLLSFLSPSTTFCENSSSENDFGGWDRDAKQFLFSFATFSLQNVTKTRKLSGFSTRNTEWRCWRTRLDPSLSECRDWWAEREFLFPSKTASWDCWKLCLPPMDTRFCLYPCNQTKTTRLGQSTCPPGIWLERACWASASSQRNPSSWFSRCWSRQGRCFRWCIVSRWCRANKSLALRTLGARCKPASLACLG